MPVRTRASLILAAFVIEWGFVTTATIWNLEMSYFTPFIIPGR